MSCYLKPRGSKSWGFKVTNTHLYLMEREREGEMRYEILRSLANSLGFNDFFPWGLSGRGSRCHLGSSDNRQYDDRISTRRQWLPAAQSAPRRLCRSKLRHAVRKDRVLLVAGGQAGATTIADAQGRSRFLLSAA